jgi:hypothetical protein
LKACRFSDQRIRLALHGLDRTGDLSVSSQADLRRILAARIVGLKGETETPIKTP